MAIRNNRWPGCAGLPCVAVLCSMINTGIAADSPHTVQSNRYPEFPCGLSQYTLGSKESSQAMANLAFDQRVACQLHRNQQDHVHIPHLIRLFPDELSKHIQCYSSYWHSNGCIQNEEFSVSILLIQSPNPCILWPRHNSSSFPLYRGATPVLV